VRDVQLDRAFEHARGVLDQERPELLAARDVLLERLLLELPDELGRRRDPDVGGDQNLLDPLPELLVVGVPKLRHSRVELPDDGLPTPAQPPPEPPEPPAGLLHLGGRLGVGRLLDRIGLRERLLYLARYSLLDLRPLRRLFPLGQDPLRREHLVFGARSLVDVLGRYAGPGLYLRLLGPSEEATPRTRHG
jgi:hypothetical protein